MRSGIVSALLLVASLALVAAPAHARGGQYRGPSGSVPPGLREPSDPMPPPPPPPSSRPTVPMPTTPTTPTAPKPVPPRPHPGDGAMTAPTPSRGPILPWSFESWPFWYHHHKAMLEWPLGRPATIRPEGETAPVHQAALDAILAAAAPKMDQHPSITGTALVALGKVATSKEHVEVLLATLADRNGPHLLFQRESAALGLGLLRRHGTHPFLDAPDLARIREALFAVLEGDREQVRLRGFAAAAIGLLGDQANEAPEATTARLFAVFDTKPANIDVLRGVMVALIRQPSRSFTVPQKDALREIAFQGTLGGRRMQQLLRCDALGVLGRVGDASDLPRLRALLAQERGMGMNEKRSAVLALGFLASRLPQEARIAATKDLLGLAMGGTRDTTTRCFALVMLPRVLAGPRGDETRAVLDATLAGEVLLVKARYGQEIQRPWAALALAEVLRDLPWSRKVDLGRFERTARVALRVGLEDESVLSRAGFALALGIAQDRESEEALRALAADRHQDRRVRAYAALGLGHMGTSTDETRKVLREALTDRSSEILRVLTADALGLANDEASIPALAGEVALHRSLTSKGEAAAALARLRSPEAAEALLELAKSEVVPTRAIAIAGLGRVLDPGFYPSMVLLTWRFNYRASSNLISELYSIL